MVIPGSWRDCQAWKADGIELSTTNNETAKLYDAALHQIMSLTNDPSLGGLPSTIQRMVETDPNFLMGQLFKEMSSIDVVTPGEETIQNLERLRVIAQSNRVASWEKLCFEAVEHQIYGRQLEASRIYERNSMLNPNEIFSISRLFVLNINTGYSEQMKNSLGYAVNAYSEKKPLYNYLLGRYGFALNECNKNSEGEKWARKGLDLNNGRDPWATHAVSHVLLDSSRSAEGIHFLRSTEADWRKGDMFLGHNAWHLGIFYVERGMYEEALELFNDTICIEACKNEAMLFLNDAASLLFRLKMEGLNVKEETIKICEVFKQHAFKHTSMFDDAHLLLTCGSDKEFCNQILDSVENFIQGNSGKYQQVVAREVGTHILKAIVEYENEEYDKVVELLLPVRYEIWMCGGSNAQRDIFHLILLSAASKSISYQDLARSLLVERTSNKQTLELNGRWLQRLSL
ncbi:DgyrCDS201 [Dimorphilus gyrociliatus]|uniref:Tetratricopeptide repeat protein 38 n=1 Tax=Dimorphilus gyrociliatus TaxID=2664684 RepID=A0A7I8V5D8_9ANNE|nr:DgyrCDS201 [Dimorphilus gyrociliatus]